MAGSREVETVNVGGRRVGPREPVFVIAEAGVNHNGDLALAHRLVDAAAEAGADAVKFQTWITEKLVAPGAPLAAYQAGQARTQFELLKELELPREAFISLAEHAKRSGLTFLSTPDEEESADFLEALGVPAFKIGSAEVTNLPFLRHVGAKRRPVILSTGMSDLAEVRAAVSSLEEAGTTELVLLHCVSSYPADAADANLRAMDSLAEEFRCPVGFSDHTLGTAVAVAAAARGASVIEKHLTLDRGLPGPDHVLSLEPGEFRRLVEDVFSAQAALGDGVKRPARAELATRKAVRRAVVAARALAAGEIVGEDAIALRRAGGGLDAARAGELLGRRLRHDVPAGAVLTVDAVE